MLVNNYLFFLPHAILEECNGIPLKIRQRLAVRLDGHLNQWQLRLVPATDQWLVFWSNKSGHSLVTNFQNIPKFI